MNIYKVTYIIDNPISKDIATEVHAFVPITCSTPNQAKKAVKEMLPEAKRIKAHLILTNVDRQ